VQAADETPVFKVIYFYIEAIELVKNNGRTAFAALAGVYTFAVQ
jgi:hypothetical protein